MGRKFNPQRLKIARKRRGFTTTELARQSGCARYTVSKLESAQNKPRESTVSSIANVLRFPSEFFYEERMDELSSATASIIPSCSVAVRDTALASASIAFLLDDWAHDQFKRSSLMPSAVDFIGIGSDVDPESAARLLRQHWGLGLEPIPHMIELLESKGVRVFSLVDDVANLSAFSGWRDEIPYLFTGKSACTVDLRLSVAKQLGYLVLHRHTRPDNFRDIQREMNAFACAFLIPEGAKLSNIGLNLKRLKETMQRWGLSGFDLIACGRKSGAISDGRYRTLHTQITNFEIFNGHIRLIPEGLSSETSVLWCGILEGLQKNGKALQDVAEQMRVPVQEVEELLLVENLPTKKVQGDLSVRLGC